MSARPRTRTAGSIPATLRGSTRDGNLIITGRAKDLIKSGGEWINPAEIEAIVGRLPEVSAGRGHRPLRPEVGRAPDTRGRNARAAVDQRRDDARSPAGAGRALVDARRGDPRAEHAAGIHGKDRQNAPEGGIRLTGRWRFSSARRRDDPTPTIDQAEAARKPAPAPSPRPRRSSAPR